MGFLMGKIQIDEERKTMVTVKEAGEEEADVTVENAGERRGEEVERSEEGANVRKAGSYEELLRENDEMRERIKALEEEKEEAGALLAKFVNTIGNMNEEIKRLRA